MYNIADLFDISLSNLYDLSSTIIKFPQTAEERNVSATKFKDV